MLDEGGHYRRWWRVEPGPGHTPVDPKEEAERVGSVVRELLSAGALVSTIRVMPRWRACASVGSADYQ